MAGGVLFASASQENRSSSAGQAFPRVAMKAKHCAQVCFSKPAVAATRSPAGPAATSLQLGLEFLYKENGQPHDHT